MAQAKYAVAPSSGRLTALMVAMGAGLVATLVAEEVWVTTQAETALRYVLLSRGLLAGMLLLSGALLLTARIAESAETAERTTKQLLDTVTAFLDELPVAAFVVNAQGRPIYSNKASVRLLGKGIEDVDPDELAEVYQAYVRGTDDPYPSERMPLIRALGGEEAATVDDMEVRIRGATHPLRVWANPVRDPDGRIRFAIAGFIEDVSTPKT